MDCKEFRDKHVPYVDQLCSALEETAMREHLRACAECSRHDTIVRRSLMLVRNLPAIEPSPDFRARLEARLRAAALEGPAQPPAPRFSYGTFAALAAGVAFATFLAAELVRRDVPGAIQLAPVVASAPSEIEPSPVATPAFVATVPTGMSVWPAIMVASQAPIHFVAAELAPER